MVSLETATVAGLAAGALYFAESERGVPAEANCSYLAPWTTDLAAWLFGAVLVERGFRHDDPLVCFIGSTVASIHVAQFAAHKVGSRRPAGELT